MGRFIDLTGRQFSRLRVVGRDYSRNDKKRIYWICECICGNIKSVRGSHLIAGAIQSCGCLKAETQREKIPDISGLKFGKLRVLRECGRNKYGSVIWLLKCDCGNYHKAITGNLVSGNITSCGCSIADVSEKRTVNIIGKRFGRWVVLRKSMMRNSNGILYVAECDCGTITYTLGATLRRGDNRSCGCLAEELKSERITHGHTSGGTVSSEYGSWQAMKDRCQNPKNVSYKHYGDRGITVCDSWQNSFDIFLKDMGEKPSVDHSLGRINNDLGYFPENCRWESAKEQARNKSSNRYITYNGETKTLTEWANKLNMSLKGLSDRLERWNIERVFTTPVKITRKNRKRWEQENSGFIGNLIHDYYGREKA